MRINPNFPLEYTRGFVEFFGLRFVVNESVLIPRFETESLVREAIRTARNESFDTLIDVGTGSGIIPISILANVNIPQAYALDLSAEALEVAQGNYDSILACPSVIPAEAGIWSHSSQIPGDSRLHGNDDKKLTFLESNLLSAFLDTTRPIGKNILLVTNLPYIRADDWENMSEDTRYEPRMALFGGDETGFELYEQLFAQIPLFLEQYQPAKLTILAEMGDDQEMIATEVLTSYGWDFSFFPDLRDIRRFIRIEIRP